MIQAFLELEPMIKAAVMIAIVLVTASILARIIQKCKPMMKMEEVIQRIRAWWIMVIFFFAAIIISPKVSFVLFGFLSFWALKEYVTILDTRRADHRTLFWAFMAIPIQYYWVATGWYGMFIIFIPVYMFLFLPIRLVLSKETKGFLVSSARIQWGIMAFVFCLSHMGFLLKLPRTEIGNIEGRALLLFLVVLTELNDVFQFLWGKAMGKRKIMPSVSPNKTWEGFIGGVCTTTVVSLAVRFLTPFSVIEAMLLAFLIGVCGFFGDVVMSAIKRDVGIKDFGSVLPGHGGILDRVDSLCYSAPIFFHIVYWHWY